MPPAYQPKLGCHIRKRTGSYHGFGADHDRCGCVSSNLRSCLAQLNIAHRPTQQHPYILMQQNVIPKMAVASTQSRYIHRQGVTSQIGASNGYSCVNLEFIKRCKPTRHRTSIFNSYSNATPQEFESDMFLMVYCITAPLTARGLQCRFTYISPIIYQFLRMEIKSCAAHACLCFLPSTI